MREVKIGMEKETKVVCLDEPGAGGACHTYEVRPNVPQNADGTDPLGPSFATVYFQDGPIKESGPNGCQNEDLLAIVIDRLEDFQTDTFACRENAYALTHLEEALMWLNKRTADRRARGVEGKSEV
jgi:hypothetical protein